MAHLPNDSLISRWKGERFNAEGWASLFEKAGARFGGVIGWHGSDFKHWNTTLSDYNSAKMGPRIDVVGDVAKAVRNKGMKFLVSFHSIKDESWLAFAKEAVEKYSPDIFWVDASFGGTKGAHHDKTMYYSKYLGNGKNQENVFPEKYQRAFITNFFNHAIDKGKEVEFVYKSYDIPPGIGMRDLENGILNHLSYDPWMTDLDMSVPPDWATHGWFYRKGVPLRSANELIDYLVDVVSKNGIFLLNIPPMADGSFPPEVVQTLEQMGYWLKQNGEAVYGTSPWFMYGEGPSEVPEGNYTFHHNNHFAKITYGKEDIRFTVHKNNLYATCLGKPEGNLKIRALNSSFRLQKGDILKITHLATGKEVAFDHSDEALIIKTAGLNMQELANAFRIELKF